MPSDADLINVLLIEDNAVQARLLQDTLQEARSAAFRLEWAGRLEHGLDRLAAGGIDVALLDLSLPDSDGLETLIRARDEAPGVPFLVLTGVDDEELGVQALHAGAQDYLVKGQVGPSLLIRAIRYAIERARTLRALKDREEQLLQSQKMEAVGRLAGGVAHDFSNMLAVVIGYSDLTLYRTDLDETVRTALEEIRKAGERALSLTRQLLAFSRRQVLAPQVLDLNQVVTQLDRMLRRLIGEDIELVFVPNPELPPIKADPGQVEQVIMNLVVNARDAMPLGGALTLRTDAVELNEEYALRHPGVEPGRYAMLAVSDTGCGMDEETKLRIFEPFFTTKREGEGTGLGLATVFGIIQQSDGHIQVLSEPGEGTTFEIYLPEVEEDLENEVLDEALVGRPTGWETILLVEDEQLVRGLVRNVLRLSGYQVLEAGYGDEALRLCEQHEGPIHLLVTDVVMPGMSGRELAERASSLRPGMRVLFMSGYTDDAVIRHGVLAAACAFLQKPFTPDAFGLKVRELLDAPPEPGPPFASAS